jgi:hypothetical protein
MSFGFGWLNRSKLLLKRFMEMDRSVAGRMTGPLCALTENYNFGFGISGVEPSGSATRELVEKEKRLYTESVLR